MALTKVTNRMQVGTSLSVYDYGTDVGTGGDDTSAIQAAIDAASDYDSINFSDGSFNITSPIILKSKLSLVGRNARITKTGAFSESMFTTGTPNGGNISGINNIYIDGLIFDGNKSGFAAGRMCVEIAGANPTYTSGQENQYELWSRTDQGFNIHITNCQFLNSPKSGTKVGNCQFVNVSSNYYEGNGDNGNYAIGCNHIVMANNICFRNDGRSIQTITCCNAVVSGNSIGEQQDDAISNAESIGIMAGYNITVSDNTVYNLTGETCSGIHIREYETDDAFSVYNVSITGNTVFTSVGQGISVQQNGSGPVIRDVSITGNTLTGGLRAIRLDACKNVQITGNTCKGMSQHGIFLVDACSNVSIKSNNIYDGGSTYSGVQISGSSTDTIIEANNIFNTGAGGFTNGVRLDASEIFVRNNIFTGVNGVTNPLSATTANERSNKGWRIEGNELGTFQPKELEVNAVAPWVTLGEIFKTANTSSTAITNFQGGYENKKIRVVIDDANTSIDFTSSNLMGNGQVSYSASSGDFLECTYTNGKWYCLIS